MGPAADSPGNKFTERRRRKALATWRFQPGFVRPKPAANGSGGAAMEVMVGRMRRKAVAAWRFQAGRRRTFDEAFAAPNISSSIRQCSTLPSGSCIPGAASGVRKKYPPALRIKFKGSAGVGGDVIAAESVQKSLREFHGIYKELLAEDRADGRKPGNLNRADLIAYKIYRERNKLASDGQRHIGDVPGVKAGNVFHLRVELSIAGLHRETTAGVDYINENGMCIAVSVVSNEHYSNIKRKLEYVVYTGMAVASPDQRIDGSNLALKRSMETRTPIRLIQGFVKFRKEMIHENKFKMLSTYIYCGCYLIVKYWREKCGNGSFVYKFRMKRMPGQPHVDLEEALNSRRVEASYNVYIQDVSLGLEEKPIPVINDVDNEHPRPFTYMTKLKYPMNHVPAPSEGCDCVGGCSDSDKCACAVKNGGTLPFNHQGRIIEAKPLVYECGPHCKCPPTCHNRVSQHGIKFRLEVFKTKSMGYGVRSRDAIPSGSFICQYIGELLEDDDAQKRTIDEYIFAIGNNYYDESLWEGLSTSIPALQNGPGDFNEEVGFAVDASISGNVARFINHSCTPNAYAQNLLYDHDDKRMPRITFFASEDIPPYQELSYHYNYSVDQVHDASGKIKKKKCFCNTEECTGWLY